MDKFVLQNKYFMKYWKWGIWVNGIPPSGVKDKIKDVTLIKNGRREYMRLTIDQTRALEGCPVSDIKMLKSLISHIQMTISKFHIN